MMRLLLISLLLLATGLKAQDYAGGYIGYKHLGNDVYKITQVYLSNCISCFDTTNCPLPMQADLQIGTNKLKLNYEIEKTTEIEVLSCHKCTRCIDPDCALYFGYKYYHLSDTINLRNLLKNSSNCRVDVYSTINQLDTLIDVVRAKEITQELHFDACNADESPAYNVFNMVCIGSDSVYEMAKPHSKNLKYSFSDISATNIDYEIGYSNDTFIYYLGFYNQDYKKDTPFGVHLNPEGTLFFRNMRTQSTLTRMEAIEMINGQWVSTQKVDFGFKSIKCVGNSKPLASGFNCSKPIEGNMVLKIPAGDSVTTMICTSDKDRHDTVSIEGVYHNTRGAWHVDNLQSKRQNLVFTWYTKRSDISTKPYNLHVKLKDNSCGGSKYKTYKYQIWVVDDTSKIINIPYADTPEINLYPNPTNSNLTIESSELVRSIQLVSVCGKVSFQKQLNSKTQIVNLNQLEPGFYQAILYLENGAVDYKKVLKR
ncbi:MAG: T9SS type A sorting domain-containing protein [Bacteroidetes bacterium]|nr:T9SS type A sorting domain-containing protein [Bacteroidota bacterium]